MKVQFRPGELLPRLEERATGGQSISQVADRDLARFYDLLALALAQCDLSEGEAGLIVDTLNGTWIDLNAAQMLAYEIEDSLADGLAEKWEVDGRTLVAKLRGYGLLQRVAICDAVERFWHDSYHITSTSDRLVRVGLVKPKV